MANAATPAKSLSTADVFPQDRGFDSDKEQITCVGPIDTTATDGMSWSPGMKIRITGIRVCAGAAALNATNDVVVDIDIEDPSASTTKKHDVMTNFDSAITAQNVAAYGYFECTLSSTEANLVVEDDEIVKIVATNATGDGQQVTIAFKYVVLQVNSPGITWPVAVT